MREAWKGSPKKVKVPVLLAGLLFTETDLCVLKDLLTNLLQNMNCESLDQMLVSISSFPATAAHCFRRQFTYQKRDEKLASLLIKAEF